MNPKALTSIHWSDLQQIDSLHVVDLKALQAHTWIGKDCKRDGSDEEHILKVACDIAHNERLVTEGEVLGGSNARARGYELVDAADRGDRASAIARLSDRRSLASTGCNGPGTALQQVDDPCALQSLNRNGFRLLPMPKNNRLIRPLVSC